MNNLLSIQQAANFLKVSAKTLRRWEAKGILVPQRTPGNQRRYTQEQIENFKTGGNVGPEVIQPVEVTMASSQELRNTFHQRRQSKVVNSSPMSPDYWSREFVNSVNSFKKMALSAVFIMLFVFAAGLVFATLKSTNLLNNEGFSKILAVAGIKGKSEAPVYENVSDYKNRAVLGQETKTNRFVFSVNIPSEFAKSVQFLDTIKVSGIATLSGGIITENSNIDAGTGTLTASNVVYGLVAGTGIAIGSGQTPTVTNTGVLSVGGQTGVISLAAGTGITISGNTITNSSPDTTSNTFKNIVIGSDTIIASGSNDSLNIAAGTGISLSTNTTSKTFTINSTDTSGGSNWRIGTGALSPINDTLDVLIGNSSSSSAEFGVTGINDGTPVATISATTNGNGLSLTGSTATIQSLRMNTLTLGGSSTGDIVFSPGGVTALTARGANLIAAGTLTGLTGLTSSGTITFSGFSSNGGPLYTNASGVLAQVTAGTATQVLHGGTTPSFSAVSLTADVSGILPTANGGSFWNSSLGGLFPGNSTLDLLIGGTTTSSAKFAVLNVAGGTPTASISANSGNIATYLTGNGTLATTNRQTLTIGNSSTYNTTGNVLINPNETGNVGIGLTSPATTLDIAKSTNDSIGTVNITRTNATGGDTLKISANAGQLLRLTATGNGSSALYAESSTFTSGTYLNLNQSSSTYTGTGLLMNFGQASGSFTGNFVDLKVNSASKFTISSGGAASMAGNLTFDTTGVIQTTNNQTLTLGGDTTGDLILKSRNAVVFKNPGTNNTFVGEGAGHVNPPGTDNTALGYASLTNTTGSFNTGVGSSTLLTSNGSYNTALGYASLGSVGMSGSSNTAVGYQTLRGVAAATGSNNTALGYQALYSNTSGSTNTALGYQAGYVASGQYNNLTGSNNVYLGYNAGPWTQNASFNNSTAIGAYSLVNASNAMALGGTGFYAVNVGIGTATPSAVLDIQGGQRGGNSALIVNQTGAAANDIFTASTSGTTRFRVANTGELVFGDNNSAFFGTLDLATLTTGRTYTFPNTTGTVCISGDTCATSGTVGYWNQSTLGTLFPGNSTVDLLVGGASTASSKFAFVNVAGGTPTASISANSGNNATFLTGGGTLGTTNRQTLTLGGSSTGDISLNARNGLGTTSIVSDLSQGARSADVLSITQADNASSNSTGNLFQLTNSDTASTVAVASIEQSASAGIALEITAANGFTSGGIGIDFTNTAINSGGIGINIPLMGSSSTGISIAGQSGTGLSITTLTTGVGIFVDEPSTGGVGIDLQGALITGGVGFRVADTASASLTAFTGDILQIAPSRTHTGATVITDTGNYLDLTRSNTMNNAGGTYNITGDLATFSSNCTQTSGTCVDTSNILRLTQSFGKASGAVLNIENSGVGSAAAIFSNSGGQSALIINKTGNAGDIFTASSSGTTRFAVDLSGNIQFGGGQTALSSLIKTGATARTFTFPDETGTLCIQGSGNCGFSLGTNLWKQTAVAGAITPINSTLDLLVGGDTTASARFAFMNTAGTLTPTASISANSGNIATYLTGDGTLATTNRQTLTLGGGDTGNILLSPMNGINGSNLLVDATTATLSGDLAVNGGDITTTVTTFNVSLPNSGIINFKAGGDTFLTFDEISAIAGYVATTLDISSNCTGVGCYGMDINFEDAGSGPVGGVRLTNLSSFISTGYGLFRLDNNSGANVSEGILFTTTSGGYTDAIDVSDAEITNAIDVGQNFILFDGTQLFGNATGSLTFEDTSGNDFLKLSSVGTAPAASISAATSYAALVTDNRGVGDLFTASKSGATKFTILNNGNLQFAGQTNFLTTLTSAATQAQTITFPDATGTLCIQGSGNCGFSLGTNLWKTTAIAGALTPINSTLDLLVGGDTTASAKFAVLNINSGTPTASIAGNFVLGSAAGTTKTIGATAMNALQMGDAATGDLILAPANTAAVTIKNGGNVGIGTTSPTSLLSLAKNNVITIATSDGVDDGQLQIAGAGVASAARGATIILAGNEDSQTGKLFLRAGNAVGAAVVMDIGNVGIGTATPLATLDVNGTASVAGAFTLYTTPTIQSTTKQTLTLGGDTTGGINFKPGNIQTALLSSIGRIGVGTQTAPKGLLDISGDAGNNATLIINNTGVSTSDLLTASASGTTKFTIDNSGNFAWPNAATVSLANVTNALNFDSNTLTIDANLNRVGIGTSTPDEMFEIENLAGGFTYATMRMTTGTAILQAYAANTEGKAGLGTRNAYPFTLESNNTVRLYLDTVGRIALGTPSFTTPIALLDIKGNAGNNASLIVDNTGVSTSDLFTASASGATKLVLTNSGSLNLGTGSASVSSTFNLNVMNSSNSTAAAQFWNTFPNAGGTTGPCTNSLCHSALSLRLGAVGSTGNAGAADRFLNLAIGNGTIIGKIRGNDSGGVVFDTAGGDYAEWFQKEVADEQFEFGDVVCMNSNGKVVKCDSDNTKVLGAVTDSPGFVGNSGHDEDPSYILVGLLGQIRVNASAENGSISGGDMITYSSQAGVGAKAVRPGFVLARAIEPIATGSARILAYIQPTWYDPGIYVTADGSLNNPYAQFSAEEASQLLGLISSPVSGSAQTINDPVSSASGSFDLANDPLFQNIQNRVTGLELNTQSLSQRVDQLASESAFLQSMLDGAVLGASASATIVPDLTNINAESATISGNLMVLGRTTTADLGVTGNIAAGLLSIHGLDSAVNNGDGGATINSIGDLNLQNNGLGGINILAGKVKIDTSGNIVTQGTITTKKIKIDTTTDTPSKSLGSGTILAGDTTVDITTSAVTNKSKIFVTATTKTGGQALLVTQKTAGTGFTVEIETPYISNIKFDWWIVDEK